MRPAILALLLLSSSAARADAPDDAPPRGFILGAQAGAAQLSAITGSPARVGLALGLRAGSRFSNGLSTALRWDELGMRVHGSSGMPWQLLGIEGRYTWQALQPRPFAELVP